MRKLNLPMTCNVRTGFRRSLATIFLGLGGVSLVPLLTTAKTAQQRPEHIVGPNACAECHKDETKVWKGTHHYKTFRAMPRRKEARQIARKLNIKRIKTEPLCLGCHFTQEKVRNRRRVTAGISCESCHGPAKGWEKLHSEFSGKKNKQSESKSEAASRWKASERKGMIRPNDLYKLAKNCYGCHVVPNEKLVNVGGHAAGSPFELLSWSQGEIRHNLWYSKGKNNVLASKKRQRMMYLMGIAVELETALRAVAVATKKKAYAIKMAHRANHARQKMTEVAKVAADFPELRNIVRFSHEAGLKLNNENALTAAANKIAKEAKAMLTKYDGSQFASIDKLLPSAKTYKGQPAK